MSQSSLTILVVLAVALVALVGGRLLLRTRGGRRPGYFRVSMALYLGLGLVAGAQGIGILGGELLHNLEPVKDLALGWIGLLFGLQLRYKHLKRFPARFHRTALCEAVCSMALVALALWFALGRHLAEESAGPGIILLAALGGVSSPTATALAAVGGGRIRHNLARLAHFATSLDPLAPLVAFTLMAGYYHPSGGGWRAAAEWLAASVLVGLVLGLLFYSFARHRHGKREMTMLIIAFTVFSGGVAAHLGLSSLFIAVVMGATLANFLPSSEIIFRELSAREKPILILLLVLTGAGWRPAEAAGLVLILAGLAVYLAARVAGKLGAMALICRSARGELEKGSTLGGLALLGQGGMSLALIANFQLLERDALAQTAVSVGLLAVVAAETFSARAARAALYAGQGEGEG